MTIHREGRTLLLGLFIILLLANGAVTYYFAPDTTFQYIVIAASLILFFLFLQFFRQPLFEVQKNSKYVMAPADGKIVVIEDTDETEYLKSRRKQISIFMSPLNVHVNRMPVGGSISYFKYHPGKYLVAWHPKSSTENERTTVVAKMPSGTEILFRQIAGALARRIICYAKEGEVLEQGQEFGFIKFGSRVDVFLPVNADIRVKIGDVAKGGKTILAELP